MDGKAKIFILDDEEEALYLLKKVLTTRGFEVEVAPDSRVAFEQIKKFNPCLILLDLRMPHVGGFEFCEMLNNDAQTQRIPIIVISVFVDGADIKRAYQLGAGGYIKKPFTMDQLMREIERVIGYKYGQAS